MKAPATELSAATAPAGELDVEITYLEMREPPPGRGAALREAPPGATLLHEPAPSFALYRWLYDTVGEPWLWWERRTWSEEKLLAEIRAPGVELWVLRQDGAPAGYAELDFRHRPDAILAYFGLIPEFIGRGLGSWLLRASLDLLWREGVARVRLNTCTLDHPRALGNYVRAGFRATCTEHRRIRDPRLLGIIPLAAAAGAGGS